MHYTIHPDKNMFSQFLKLVHIIMYDIFVPYFGTLRPNIDFQLTLIGMSYESKKNAHF